jgi:hypothetical protein
MTESLITYRLTLQEQLSVVTFGRASKASARRRRQSLMADSLAAFSVGVFKHSTQRQLELQNDPD